MQVNVKKSNTWWWLNEPKCCEKWRMYGMFTLRIVMTEYHKQTNYLHFVHRLNVFFHPVHTIYEFKANYLYFVHCSSYVHSSCGHSMNLRLLYLHFVWHPRSRYNHVSELSQCLFVEYKTLSSSTETHVCSRPVWSFRIIEGKVRNLCLVRQLFQLQRPTELWQASVVVINVTALWSSVILDPALYVEIWRTCTHDIFCHIKQKTDILSIRNAYKKLYLIPILTLWSDQ